MTSSDITKTIATNYQKGNNDRRRHNHDRASSVDSEEERFNKWQQDREDKLNAPNYIKDDKIYTDTSYKANRNDKSTEKKRLRNFLTSYKNDRFKPKNKKRNSSIRSHLTDVNTSNVGKGTISGNTSTKVLKTKESGPDSLNEEISEKRETNFFDIFMAISKPIVDDKKAKRRMKKKARRQARAHSNAVSEPNFLR